MSKSSPVLWNYGSNRMYLKDRVFHRRKETDIAVLQQKCLDDWNRNTKTTQVNGETVYKLLKEDVRETQHPFKTFDALKTFLKQHLLNGQDTLNENELTDLILNFKQSQLDDALCNAYLQTHKAHADNELTKRDKILTQINKDNSLAQEDSFKLKMEYQLPQQLSEHSTSYTLLDNGKIQIEETAKVTEVIEKKYQLAYRKDNHTFLYREKDFESYRFKSTDEQPFAVLHSKVELTPAKQGKHARVKVKEVNVDVHDLSAMEDITVTNGLRQEVTEEASQAAITRLKNKKENPLHPLLDKRTLFEKFVAWIVESLRKMIPDTRNKVHAQTERQETPRRSSGAGSNHTL